jgi:hypothetical protein
LLDAGREVVTERVVLDEREESAERRLCRHLREEECDNAGKTAVVAVAKPVVAAEESLGERRVSGERR